MKSHLYSGRRVTCAGFSRARWTRGSNTGSSGTWASDHTDDGETNDDVLMINLHFIQR